MYWDDSMLDDKYSTVHAFNAYGSIKTEIDN